jgi:hypothetical protein
LIYFFSSFFPLFFFRFRFRQFVNFSCNYHKQETIESEFHAFIASEKGGAGAGTGASTGQATVPQPPEYKAMAVRETSTSDPPEKPPRRQVPYETAIDEIEIVETSFGVSVCRSFVRSNNRKLKTKRC